MAKPKKPVVPPAIEVPEAAEIGSIQTIASPIALLSIDYPSEGLNDMARKINEIILNLNAK